MNIKILKQFNLGVKAQTVRSCEVNLGYETGRLFVYSESPNSDPCDSYFTFHKYPVHIAMYGEQGNQIWHKELGMGVIPGVWFLPFVAHDMDGDGVDEIWFINNPTDKPLLIRGKYVERLDARTGETIGKYDFPGENGAYEIMVEAYRHMLIAGKVNGEPVLVMQQGTYRNMYFQCYNADMSLRWERIISADDGPRASHHVPVFDINNDGIDEILFGERAISLDNGEDIFCVDRDKFFGHSDVVQPFYDPKSKKGYLFTCRENGDYEGCPRVVMTDFDGNHVWEDIYTDDVSIWGRGHIHGGYVFSAKPDYRKIAVAKHANGEVYIFDAISGERTDYPADLRWLRPIDLNGDGYHEFLFWQEGHMNARVHNADGKLVCCTGGEIICIGKWYGFAGEQFLAYYTEEGVVRLWGDADAADTPIFKERRSNEYFANLNKQTGNGYNWLPTADAAI